MGHQPDPRFSVGQRVKSFRGELATVRSVHPSPIIGKSHRVKVHFDKDTKPTNIAYYEEVFEPAEKMSLDDVTDWTRNLSPSQFGRR